MPGLQVGAVNSLPGSGARSYITRGIACGEGAAVCPSRATQVNCSNGTIHQQTLLNGVCALPGVHCSHVVPVHAC